MLRMGRRAMVVMGAVVLAAVACGGRVIDESESPSPRDSGTRTATSTPNDPSRPSRPDDFVGGSVALPDCKPGAPPVAGSLCEFTTGGLCYETKIEACACACPRKTGTVCGSGFPNSQGRVVVSCS
jgi:hypothetical protein